MSYKYKFQNILNYKETLEDFKKANYAQAVSLYNEEKEVLDNMKLKKEKILNNTISRVTKVGDLRMFNNYVDKITNDIENQRLLVENSKNKAQELQSELVEAMKERKVFEKLKEKDYELFQVEEKRKEDKLIDEIVTFKSRAK